MFLHVRSWLPLAVGTPGVEGTLIFSVYVGSDHYMGFKILNLGEGGFQKNDFWRGYEDFVDILWGGHHKIGLVLGSFLWIVGSFLQFKVQNGNIFVGC